MAAGRKRGRSSPPPRTTPPADRHAGPAADGTIKRHRPVQEQHDTHPTQTSDPPSLPIQPLLASRCIEPTSTRLSDATPSADPASSSAPILLAIVESTALHVDLLYHHLPALLALHPQLTLHAVLRESHPLLTDDDEAATDAPLFPLPTLVVHPRTVLPLGLLHPLGGGRTLLDAVVLLDARRCKRLTLPVGWGEGAMLASRAPGDASARILGQRMVERLREELAL